MSELEWYYPKSSDEAANLVAKDGFVAHGGRTSLLRSPQSRTKALIDLSGTQLDYCTIEGGWIEIGAVHTYASAAKVMRQQNTNHILAKSLSAAASTPLRNRITIGGSVALAPVWSDLVGPLAALESKVVLRGSNIGTFALHDYLKNRDLRRNSLVAAVRFKQLDIAAFYHRATRTRCDYPAFSVTILAGNSQTYRIVIAGCTERYKRLFSLEEAVKENPAPGSLEKIIATHVQVSFAGKKLGSPEYVRHLAMVSLQRGLSELGYKG